jgi:hypothetical protein
MNRVLIIVALVSLTFLVAPHAGAQANFVSFGAGAGGEGFAYGVDWTLQTKALSFSARLIRTEEMQFLGSAKPNRSASDIALMAGVRSVYEDRWCVTFEAGPGYVTTVGRGEFLYSDPGWFSGTYYEEIDKSAVGLAFQSQMYYRSVGLVVFGNINDARSFAGVLFSFRLGSR